MDIHWIWQTVLIFFVGTLILRIGGRKSISQMTISQTIVMIGLGSLLIQPVTGNGLYVTFLVGALLTLLMILLEYVEMKFDFLETLFAGKAVIVIEDGKPNLQNLKKIRMAIDRLETRLRQAGIASIEDVKHGTIEVSGQLGYELKDSKKPLTRDDLTTLMNEVTQVKTMINRNWVPQVNQPPTNNIFQEIYSDKFEGNSKEPQM